MQQLINRWIFLIPAEESFRFFFFILDGLHDVIFFFCVFLIRMDNHSLVDKKKKSFLDPAVNTAGQKGAQEGGDPNHTR